MGFRRASSSYGQIRFDILKDTIIKNRGTRVICYKYSLSSVFENIVKNDFSLGSFSNQNTWEKILLDLKVRLNDSPILLTTNNNPISHVTNDYIKLNLTIIQQSQFGNRINSIFPVISNRVVQNSRLTRNDLNPVPIKSNVISNTIPVNTNPKNNPGLLIELNLTPLNNNSSIFSNHFDSILLIFDNKSLHNDDKILVLKVGNNPWLFVASNETPFDRNISIFNQNSDRIMRLASCYLTVLHSHLGILIDNQTNRLIFLGFG